jgi:hypothetical protein
MQELRAVSFENGVLQAAYDGEFPEEHAELMLRPESISVMEKALQRLTGLPEARVLIKRWVEGVSDGTAQNRKVSSPEVRERMERHPFVQQVLELFGGEIIDARG